MAIEDVLVQNWQGVVGLLALLVAIYALHVARRTFLMEYEAREVRIDLVAERIPLSSENQAEMWKVQLFNDTGTSQVVRDLWLRIVEYPFDISDEQAARLATIMKAFTDATHGLMSRADVYQSIRNLSKSPEYARHWFPRLAAKVLNVYDKLAKGRIELTGADRYLSFAVNRMFFDLGAVSSALTTPRRLDFGRYLFWRGFADDLWQQETFLVARDNITIPSKEMRPVDIEVRNLYAAFQNSLGLIGGEFALSCLLEARVSNAAHRSESEVFDVTITLPMADLRPLVDQIHKEAAGMKWPPERSVCPSRLVV